LCSGLVDLAIGVRHHGRDAHRFALASERFVGLVAEDLALVRDHCAELGACRRGEGTECETGDGGCRFEASEAVEEDRESCQGERDVFDDLPRVAVAVARTRLHVGVFARRYRDRTATRRPDWV